MRAEVCVNGCDDSAYLLILMRAKIRAKIRLCRFAYVASFIGPSGPPTTAIVFSPGISTVGGPEGPIEQLVVRVNKQRASGTHASRSVRERCKVESPVCGLGPYPGYSLRLVVCVAVFYFFAKSLDTAPASSASSFNAIEIRSASSVITIRMLVASSKH